MVRINLLRKNSPKRAMHTAVKLKLPLRPIVAVIVVAALSGAVVKGWRYLPQKEKTEPAPATVQAPPTSFAPSTHKKSDIVEDVVREISDERAAGLKKRSSDMPYEELSFLEKVNFEALFAKTVFEILSRAIPQGIGLRTLEVDNFQTIYAVGLGSSRELVSSTFLALKSEKLELLPKPLSYITSNGSNGYRFVVTCKTLFGLDFADQFQASDHLASRDDLPLLVKKIAVIADSAHVKFSDDPKAFDAEKIGSLRRFSYRFKGISTYNNFVKFLLDVYADRLPCAFKKINLKAQNGSAVEIEAQIIFTVKD